MDDDSSDAVASPSLDDPAKIVGHKTLYDTESRSFRHEPLTAGEADKIWEACEARRIKRQRDMPTDRDALLALLEAYERLRELGWQEAIYCPKDGTTFDAIEAGSTGIHDCHYMGDWPDGHWWIRDAGDLWPSRPILFRAKATKGPAPAGEPNPDEANHNQGAA